MILPLFVAITMFLLVAGGISVFGYRHYVRPAQVRERIGQPVVMGNAVSSGGKSGSERAVEFLRMIGSHVPKGKAGNELRTLLTRAGYRRDIAPHIFVGARIATIALLALGAFLLPLGPHPNPALRLVTLFGSAGIGWRIPGIVLKKQVAARQERLRLSLPDALDMIIVSVEAGLGIDQAIQYVAMELHGKEHEDLSEELQLMGMEMRAGLRRVDALRSFAERVGEEEIQKLLAILIQNDRFGTGLGEALRNHSQYMRVNRKQLADERAAKVGVKLVFPIFLFILPSMMIVAAGPGMLQIFKFLFPMMQHTR